MKSTCDGESIALSQLWRGALQEAYMYANVLYKVNI